MPAILWYVDYNIYYVASSTHESYTQGTYIRYTESDELVVFEGEQQTDSRLFVEQLILKHKFEIEQINKRQSANIANLCATLSAHVDRSVQHGEQCNTSFILNAVLDVMECEMLELNKTKVTISRVDIKPILLEILGKYGVTHAFDLGVDTIIDTDPKIFGDMIETLLQHISNPTNMYVDMQDECLHIIVNGSTVVASRADIYQTNRSDLRKVYLLAKKISVVFDIHNSYEFICTKH